MTFGNFSLIAPNFFSLVPVAIIFASKFDNFSSIEPPIPPVAPVKIIFNFFKSIIKIFFLNLTNH